MAQRKQYDQAIVIGGSVGGIFAARVLADFFDRVTIVESEHLSSDAKQRKNIPQGNHAHTLLIRGGRLINQYFPGTIDRLVAAGAVPVDMGHDIRWHHFGGWKAHWDDDMIGTFLSRPLVESELASAIKRFPNIEIREQTKAESLIVNEGENRVQGIRIQNKNGECEEIRGDLVIDTTGHNSLTLQQLKSENIPFDEVPIKVSYASRIYRQPTSLPPWKVLMIAQGAPSKRAGVIFPLEGGRWIATLGAYAGEAPPKTHDEFMAVARALPVPDLYRAISEAEPMSDVTTYRFPRDIRHRYDKLKNPLGGLVVLGDALCRLNPLYGQGMAAVAVESDLLRELVQKWSKTGEAFSPAFSRKYFKQAIKRTSPAWQGATLEDLRFFKDEVDLPLSTRIQQWYTRRMHLAAIDSPEVSKTFYRVANLLDPPTDLFKPSIAARVLTHGSATTEGLEIREPATSAS